MEENKENSYQKHLPLSEVGSDSFNRFIGYQIPYTLWFALKTLFPDSDIKCVYGEIDDDIIIERTDGEWGCIQIATQQTGKSPFKSTDDKILKSLRNFAILDATFPEHYNWFSILSSSGFYSDRNTNTNLQFIIDSCKKSKATSNLPNEILQWIKSNISKIKENNTAILDLTEEKLFNLISRTTLMNGAPLEQIDDKVNRQLHETAKIVTSSNSRLEAEELDLLRKKMIGHFADSIKVTTRALQTDILPFYKDSHDRLVNELYYKKGFDSKKVRDLLEVELKFIHLSAKTNNKVSPVPISYKEKSFQAELQTLEQNRFQITNTLAFSDNKREIPLPIGAILIVENSNSNITSSEENSVSSFTPLIDRVKKLIENYDISNAKNLLESAKELVLTNGSTRDKFRWHTNYAATLDIEGESATAIPYIMSALECAPTDVTALCNASYASILKGDFNEAESYARKAISFEPTNPSGYASFIASKRIKTTTDELIKEIPEAYRSSPEVAYSLGCVFKEENNLKAARKWFEISKENSLKAPLRLLLQLGEILIRTVINTKDIWTFEATSPEDTSLLIEAQQLLEQAWNEISQLPNLPEREPLLINLVYVARLLNDHKRIEEVFLRLNLHLAKFKGSDQLFKTRGLLYLERNKERDAFNDFSHNLDSSDPEMLMLLLEVSYQLNEYKTYKITCKRIFNLENIDIRIDGLSIYVSHLITKNKLRSATKILKYFQKISPNSFIYHLLNARVHRYQGNNEEALDSLKNAEKVILYKSLKSIIELTDEYTLIGKPANSVRLLEVSVNPYLDNIITRKFASFLFQAGEIKKAKILCERFNTGSSNIVFYNYLLFSIFLELHDFSQARSCLQRCIATGRQILTFELQNAFIDLRQGNILEVDKLLHSQINKSNLHLQDVELLSRLYLARELYQNALEVIYDTRRKQKNLDIDRLYARTFFNLPKYRTDWLQQERISIESAFHLTAADGNQRWFIIESPQRCQHELLEISSDDPLVQHLLGHKKDDSMEVLNNHFNQTFQITGVVHKYVLAYQETLPTVAIRTIRSKDPNDFLKELVADVEARKEHVLKLENAYSAAAITFEKFADSSGIDPLDLWQCLTFSNEMKLLCSIGTKQEMGSALSWLKNNNKLVLDLTSIFSINTLPILQDRLLSGWKEIIVPQSAIDAFNEMIFTRHGQRSGGYSIFSSQNNRVELRDISIQNIQEDKEKLKLIAAWLRNNCRVVPCNGFLSITRSKRQYFENLLGEVGAEAIELAKQEDAILYCDDLALRLFAEQARGVKTTWTEPLLRDLQTKKVLTNSDVANTICTLCELNYSYIHVSSEVLIKAFKKEGGTNCYAFDRAAAMLDEKTTYDSCLQVVTAFLFYIFGTFTDLNIKWSISEKLLNAATTRREKKKVYQDLLGIIDELPLTNLGRKISIKQALQRWAIGHLLHLQVDKDQAF